MTTGGGEAGRREATPRDYRALNRLVAAGVAKVADVRARYAGKKMRGSRERWFYLNRDAGGEALLMGAFAAEVEDEKTAKTNWKFHQQPSRREHAHLRNEFFIRVVLDAEHENARRRQRFIEVPREEIFGESCPRYPLYGARINVDKAGVPKQVRRGGRPDYEEFIPDGRIEVGWRALLRGGYPDTVCAFDLEVEMRARTWKVFEKISKRAGWIHRLVSEREREWVSGRMAAWKESNPRNTFKDGDSFREAEKAEYQRLRANTPWLGLPDAVAPVLFVYQRARMALAMRGRVAEAAARGDAGLRRYAALARKMGAKGNHDLGALFLFCGWDELRPGLEEFEEHDGEAPGGRRVVQVEKGHGRVFGKSYASLAGFTGEAARVDLHGTAAARKLMLTSRDRPGDAPAQLGRGGPA